MRHDVRRGAEGQGQRGDKEEKGHGLHVGGVEWFVLGSVVPVMVMETSDCSWSGLGSLDS